MGNKAVVVLFIFIAFIAFIVVSDMAKGNEKISPQTTAVMPTETLALIIPTNTPFIPTPRPVPTLTPTPNYIGPFGESNVYDQFCDVWCPRLFKVAILGIVLLSIYLAHDYLIYREELREWPKTEENKVEPKKKKNTIQLGEYLEVDKTKLAQFVEKSLERKGPRLAISQWKKLGWKQKDLERLLDFLHSIGLVTPRRSGMLCRYTGDYTVEYVLKEISRSVYL